MTKQGKGKGKGKGKGRKKAAARAKKTAAARDEAMANAAARSKKKAAATPASARAAASVEDGAKAPAASAARAADGAVSAGGTAPGHDGGRVAGGTGRGDDRRGSGARRPGERARDGGATSSASGGRGVSAADGADDVAAPLARLFLWADSPLAVHRLILGLGALCAALFLFDVFWPRHAYVPGEGLWGFHAIAGFVSFTAIVLGAKALRTLIRRDEDYYGAAAIDGEAYPESGLEPLGAEAGEDADDLLVVRDGRVLGGGA